MVKSEFFVESALSIFCLGILRGTTRFLGEKYLMLIGWGFSSVKITYATVAFVPYTSIRGYSLHSLIEKGTSDKDRPFACFLLFIAIIAFLVMYCTFARIYVLLSSDS